MTRLSEFQVNEFCAHSWREIEPGLFRCRKCGELRQLDRPA